MDTLNNDCLIQVLSYLPSNDKVKLLPVCKRWYDVHKYTLNCMNFDYDLYASDDTCKNWFDRYGKSVKKITTHITQFDDNYHETLHTLFYKNMYKMNLDNVRNISGINFNIFKNIKILTITYDSSIVDIHNISMLKGLEELTIQVCRLNNIDGIEKMPNLRKLTLRDNSLRCIPDGINLLTCLESLDISNNVIDKLPSTLYDLKSLKNLTINGTIIDSARISNLTSLVFLNASCCEFSGTTNVFGNLKNLEILILAHSSIIEFPTSIVSLGKLETLNMSGTGISRIPSQIVKLKNLRAFNARGCNLTSIPKSMTRMNKLEILNLADNCINSIPSVLYNINVKTLNLSKNLIEKLGEKIYLMKNIEYLDVSNNLIRYLPYNINKLDTLKQLVLSCNELKCIPMSLTKMPNIEYCNVKGNVDLIVSGLYFDASIFKVDYDNLID